MCSSDLFPSHDTDANIASDTKTIAINADNIAKKIVSDSHNKQFVGEEDVEKENKKINSTVKNSKKRK